MSAKFLVQPYRFIQTEDKDPTCVKYKDTDSKDRENAIDFELLRRDAGWALTLADQPYQNENFILNHYFSKFPPANMSRFDKLSCMTVSKNDDLLITGHVKGAVVLWQISSADFLVQLTLDENNDVGNHAAKITGVAFCKEHHKIVTTSEDTGIDRYNVIIWNYDSRMYKPLKNKKNENDQGEIVKRFCKGFKYQDKISCLYVTPKADYVVFASCDRKIHVWNFVTDEQPKRFETPHTDLILSLGILLPPALKGEEATAKYVVMSVGWDKRIVKYAFYETGTIMLEGEPPLVEDLVSRTVFDTKSHMKAITCILIHFPYGELRRQNNAEILNVAPIVLTGSLDWSVIIWDYETGTKVRQLIGHKDQVNAIKVSDRNDDGSPPIVISASLDKSIILWDMVTGEKIRILEHSEKLLSLSLYDSPEGIIIFSADVNNALIWDLRKTKRTHVLKTNKGVTVAETYTDRKTNEVKVLIGCVDNSWNMYDISMQKKTIVPSVTNTATRNPKDNKKKKKKANQKRNDRRKEKKQKIKKPEEIVYPSKVVFTHDKRINTGVIYSDETNNRDVVISGDGDGKIAVWDLTNLQRLRENTRADKDVVLSVAVYDPYLYGRTRNIDQSRPNCPHVEGNANLDLTVPFVLTGGGEKVIRVYDFLASTTNHQVHLLHTCPSGHTANIRSLVIYHPVSPSEAPLFISGSYDKTAILWDLRMMTKLRTFDDFHSNFVFFTAIYDPNIQFGPIVSRSTNNKTLDQLIPAVITSSYDGKVGIWNMFAPVSVPADPEEGKGVLLRRWFEAHKESVTALAIYTPYDAFSDPLIITGSIDRSIVIWNFLTKDKIHTLIGHIDRVCWIKIHNPPDLQHPIILSGGDDDQTIVWKDALYGRPFMPLQEVVRNAFISDCQTTDWPLITELAQKYHPLFFPENSNLFMMAVNYGRSDFLIKFWDSLVVTLPTMKTATFCLKASSNQISATESNSAIWDFFKLPFLSSQDSSEQLLQDEKNNLNNANTGNDEDNDPLDNVTRELHDKIDFKLYSSKMEEDNQKNIPSENLRQADILKVAISKCDLLAVRAIVLAWIKNLNKDMDSILTQRFYHPTYYLPMRTIQYLYYFYPSEFLFFIRNLKLIKNHPSLMEGSQEKDLTRTNRMEMKGSDVLLNYYNEFWNVKDNSEKGLWERTSEIVQKSHTDGIFRRRYFLFTLIDLFHLDVFATMSSLFSRGRYFLFTLIDLFLLDVFATMSSLFSAKSIPAQPVTSLMIPFRTNKYLIHHLQWFVDVSNQLDDVNIFTSEVAMVILNYFWQIYGRHAHVIAFMKYLEFFFCFELYAYCFNKAVACHFLMRLLTIINMGYLFHYGKEEVEQVKKMQKEITWKTICKHACDLWNVIDLMIVFFGILGSLSRLIYSEDVPYGRSFLAITSVCLWFKILYFLRPFPSTGPLVVMIIEIAREILMFLFVLFCLIAGFAQAFWLLSNNHKDSLFGTVASALKNSFLFTLGQNINAEFVGIDSPITASILLIIFLMLMMILMLNLLIALMGDVFTKARERGDGLWRKEQASIILEQEFLYERFKIKRCLLVLKYSSEVIGHIPGLKYADRLQSYLESSDAKKVEVFDPQKNVDLEEVMKMIKR